MYKKLKNKISILVLLVFIFTTLGNSININAITNELIGSGFIDETSQVIADGVVHSWYKGKTNSGFQNVNSMTIDLSNQKLELLAGKTYGKVEGMQTLTSTAKDIEKQGYKVISGINGDFYDMSNGVPLGVFIDNGNIISADRNTSKGIGFNKNNTPIIGDVTVDSKFIYNNEVYNIEAINKNRGTNSLNLYTYDFANTTGVNNQGYEVVLRSKNDIASVRVGEDIVAEVVQVRSGKEATKIEEGIIVLSASGSKVELLKNIELGSEIKISTRITEGWENINVTIGGNSILLKNGEVVENLDKNIAPRTAVGITSDNNIMLFTVDGRNPGVSEGVNLNELSYMMKEAGCVEAINLDGGGSTTIIAKIPGENDHRVLNIPSDGEERSIANSLILASRDLGKGNPYSIYVSPSNSRLLVNSKVKLNSKIVDEYYNEVVGDTKLTYEVIPQDMGEVSNEGVFTAKNVGECNIRVTGDGVEGNATINIVDNLTEIELENSSLSLQVNEVKEFNFKRITLNDKDVSVDKSQFTWEVVGDIGSIDKDGVFTAVNNSGVSGKILVKYKDIVDECEITIGQLPIILEDFENGLEYGKRKWEAEGARYTSISIESESDDKFVRFGEKSLKMNYDFTETQGTSGIYAKSTPSLEIEGYPTEIGMWVYGDGNGHWLRGQLRDGNNAAVALDFTENGIGVDWEGWRYVSSKIPVGRPMPLKMDLAVRYMETNNNNKDSGTIYIDNIRAVYGFTNDDLESPKVRDVIPEKDSVINNSNPIIKCSLSDNIGINKDTIKLLIDGKEVVHAFYPPDGSVSYTPTIPLANGKHNAKVKAKDNFGNEVEEKWSFNVDVNAPKIKINTPDYVYPGGEILLDIVAENVYDLLGLDLELGFNSEVISVSDIEFNDTIKDNVILSDWNNTLGRITLKVDKIEDGRLKNGDIIARVKLNVSKENIKDIKIDFNRGNIGYISLSNPIEFFLDSNSIVIAYPLQIEWDKESSILGYTSNIKITDYDGNKISGANIILADSNTSLGLTDENGNFETRALTENLSVKKIKVVKDNLFSKVYDFKVVNYSGFDYPTNISMSFADDTKTSMGFNWHSSAGVNLSTIQYTLADDVSFYNAKVVEADSYIDITDSGARRIYKVKIEGLKAGTEYIYRIGNEKSLKIDGSFKTEEENREEFSFVFMTDPQASKKDDFKYWNEMLTNALETNKDLDFLIMGGDLVDQGYDQQQWDYFFSSGQSNLLNIPIVAAVGNHEVMGINGVADYNKHFNNPTNGPDQTKNSTYSYNYGNTHFIVLNSEMYLDEQIEWLKKDLSNNKSDFSIVTMHRGAYGSIYDEAVIREKFTPIFDKYNVDLVLSGHDHVYARSYRMNSGEIVESNEEGTLYLLGGTAGPKTYASVERPWIEYSYDCNINNDKIYTVISVGKDDIKVVGKNINSEVIDEVIIKKQNKDSMGEIVINKPTRLSYKNISNNTLELLWESPSTIEGLVGYIIYKDGKKIGEVNKAINNYKVENLRPNTIYGLKVVSKYSNGKESKPVSINVRTKK